ncbi:hypothetical protein DAEQUDRAFT_763968 [Daedalea quercina L-15889]|uniref:Uncharacterized protein n=1 Tax=Daedalea quercina L-15889 TaxID=1314783 RepID=A0A165S0H8_9APHY|nr:hypothetical protein DAEQUDRAFT_763968 [Daedalea quercina L-15889]
MSSETLQFPRKQSAFAHLGVESSPSMVYVLEGNLPAPQRPQSGLVMYWRLHLPHKVDDSALDDGEEFYEDNLSWLAFNKWPCLEPPEWVDVPAFRSALNPRLWSFCLVSMKFVERTSTNESDWVDKGVIQFPMKGYLDVVLDTGTSGLSELFLHVQSM